MKRPVPLHIPRPASPGLRPLTALELNKTRVGVSHTLITPTLIRSAGEGTSVRSYSSAPLR